MNDPCTSVLEGKRQNFTHIFRYVPCKAFVNAFWRTWAAFCWLRCDSISPVHQLSTTAAFSRARFPLEKTHMGLFLTSDPKELKNLFHLYRWGPQSHTRLAAVPRTDLTSSKALAWSCFSSTATFFTCFPPTLALPSNFKVQQLIQILLRSCCH